MGKFSQIKSSKPDSNPLSNQLFSQTKGMAISSILFQIHRLVWKWSPVMSIIHIKLKNQFPQRENHLKTWQKMFFNKTLRLIQIIMDQFMIHRNIWPLRDRHPIMVPSANCYRIMDPKEIYIMEIREIPQVFIRVIQTNRQPFLKVRLGFFLFQ